MPGFSGMPIRETLSSAHMRRTTADCQVQKSRPHKAGHSRDQTKHHLVAESRPDVDGNLVHILEAIDGPQQPPFIIIR